VKPVLKVKVIVLTGLVLPMFTVPRFWVAGATTSTGLIVKASVVVEVRVPELPVTVTAAVPGVAESSAVNVSTLVPLVGLGANDALTPLGRPDTSRLTLSVNPFRPVTEIVVELGTPWPTPKELGQAPIVKSGDVWTTS
jgi:hypothetical protein